METSLFIARLLAVIYLAVGLGLLVSRSFYEKMFAEFTENRAFLYLGGLLALVCGFLVLTFHNRWDGDWTVVITLLGWAALLKGAALLILPDAMSRMTKKWSGMLTFGWIFALGFGLFFAYIGFVRGA